jgi:hypothetical protein
VPSQFVSHLQAVAGGDVFMQKIPPVQVLEGQHRLQGHVHDGLCRQRQRGRHRRALVLLQEAANNQKRVIQQSNGIKFQNLPFQIGVTVVGVDEQRRPHLRVAQGHDAVDVAVVHAVKVEPFLQHHGDLQSRRLIRHGFDVNLALLAVCVNVHGVQESAESALLSNAPQLDLGPKNGGKREKISISRSPAEGRFRSPLSATEIHASGLTNSLI